MEYLVIIKELDSLKGPTLTEAFSMMGASCQKAKQIAMKKAEKEFLVFEEE